MICSLDEYRITDYGINRDGSRNRGRVYAQSYMLYCFHLFDGGAEFMAGTTKGSVRALRAARLGHWRSIRRSRPLSTQEPCRRFQWDVPLREYGVLICGAGILLNKGASNNLKAT